MRRRFTGETRQEAHKAISADLAITEAARERAILAAHSLHQRVLETSLLLAVRYSAHRTAGHRVFKKVSPRCDALVVSLADDAATRFFRALLAPLEPNERRDGIPGLRFTFTQNNLELRLLDVDGRVTPCRVVVRGIKEDDWTRIWGAIRHTAYGGKCVDPRLECSPQLSSGERHGYDFHWQHCGPVALGSAMLRRIGLVANAAAIDVWSGLGGTALHLETAQGPSVFSLVEDLCDPVAGILGEGVVLDGTRGPVEPSAKFARIVDRSPTPDRFVGRLRDQGEPPALALRTVGRPGAAANR
ncbi:hypothetical protein [Amycolatopsis sp. NPDC050768]|uniref:hypothetical protein n=1 Tax=Amycolatopsis sp. NPDC050768 TaxID=3154839 RepID=UPI0033DF5D5F